LADLIGKDVAEKLLAQPRDGTLRSLTGSYLPSDFYCFFEFAPGWHGLLYAGFLHLT